MATEQGVYAQVVMICRKYLGGFKEKENSYKYISQGHLKNQYAGLVLIIIG